MRIKTDKDLVSHHRLADKLRNSITDLPTAALANDSVTAAKIAAGAVGNSELATDAVTLAKMANNSVGTAELVDGSVTLAKLNASARPMQYIGGGVMSADLSGGTITTSFKTLKSFGSITLAAGKAMFFLLKASVVGRVTSTTARTVQLRVILGSATIATGNITFSTKTATRVNMSNIIDVFETVGARTGTLAVQIRSTHAQIVTTPTSSTWGFYATIPN